MHTTSTKNRHGRSGSNVNQHRSFSRTQTRYGKFHTTRPSRGSGSNQGQGRGRTTRKIPTFDPSRFINTNPIDTVSEIYTPRNTFGTFGLSVNLVRTIASLNMTAPTPIQDQIIPEILKGRDVIGLAETGTGKTAAFLIPLIEKAQREQNRQTLILAPTRELALQIESELQKLSRNCRIFSVSCVGGVHINPQIKALRRANHFIIGTPGRILDLIKRECFLPAKVTTVVLDEADRMLDMGFINDMKKILSATPSHRETHLFSATISTDTRKLIHNFLNDPVTISVKKRDVTNLIAQDVIRYADHTKFATLLNLLKDAGFSRVLIFGAKKHGVTKLAQQLSLNGVQTESIHGNKTHNQRQRSLEKFKKGSARVLVATDVAARGIHVDDISHVINYDLPNTFEDYVHRIGRTGRATKQGKALSFVPIL